MPKTKFGNTRMIHLHPSLMFAFRSITVFFFAKKLLRFILHQKMHFAGDTN